MRMGQGHRALQLVRIYLPELYPERQRPKRAKEKVKTYKLKYNPNNPRRIAPAQLDRLKRSITEFPQMMELRPMVYDPATMQVLGGNQRLAAIKSLDMTDIPDTWAIPASALTDAQKKEFILKDNIPLGEWDFAVLESDFAEFELGEIGIEVPDGFGSDDPEVTEDDYEQPEQIETDIKLGDLFSLRKDGKEIHRLLCGDATKKEDVERLMGGVKADMMLTDPPYGIAYAEPRNWAKPDDNTRPIIGDNKPFNFPDYAFPQTKCISLWGANYYSGSIPGYASGNYVVWAKAHSEEENAVFGSAFELCWQYPSHKQVIWYERRINMGADETASIQPRSRWR